MIGAFACPDCGSPVAPRSHTPGRRVRCAGCGALVEVPFLPRAVRAGRRRHAAGWMWAGGGVVVAVLMVVAAAGVARSRGRAARADKVAAHLAAAEAAEASGRVDEALAEVEAAVLLAERLDAGDLKRVRVRRDLLAVREAEARLSDAGAAPDPVETLRVLYARVEADRALEPVRVRVIEALADALARRAVAELAEAEKALRSGRHAAALDLCGRVARVAEELGYDRASDVKESARGLAQEIVGEVGVVFAPVEGEFLEGPASAAVHASALHPILADALKRRGFLPRPARSPFASAWDAAPHRVTVEVVERDDGTFFQTPLHTARLNAHVVLSKGEATIWQCRSQGRTRVPPPSMSAFETSRVSLARARDPAIEKRLYDDARLVLAENLSAALRNLPAAAGSGP